MSQIMKYDPKDYPEGYAGKFGYGRVFWGRKFESFMNGFSMTEYTKVKYDRITNFGKRKQAVVLNIILFAGEFKETQHIEKDSIIILDEICLLKETKCIFGKDKIKEGNQKGLEMKFLAGIRLLLGRRKGSEKTWSNVDFGKTYVGKVKGEFFCIVSPSNSNKRRNKVLVVKIEVVEKKPTYIGLICVKKDWLTRLRSISLQKEEIGRIYKFSLERLKNMIK